MQDNKQHLLDNLRKPRVHITYDLEKEGAFIVKELPFVIGIIANINDGHDKNNYSERKFIHINKTNFNEVLSSFNCFLEIGFTFKGERYSEIFTFNKVSDFNPTNLIKNSLVLNKDFETRTKLNELKLRISNNSSLFKIIESISEKISKSQTLDLENELKNFQFINKEQQDYIIDLIEIYCKINELSNNPIQTIQNQILKIDQNLNNSLDEILHNNSFKEKEATFRGIEYVVASLPSLDSIKIKLLNATFEEINSDFEKILEFEDSCLFKKIYEEGFGTYGADPFSCLIMDYEVIRSNKSYNYVSKLSEVAACAHCPFILGTHQSLFNLQSYTEMHMIKSIAQTLDSLEMKKWQSFRESEESKYIALVLPRFMSRAPYEVINNPIKDLHYNENIKNHNDFLWTNAAYAFAVRIGNSFAQYGWFSSIIGPENGGMVQDLPLYVYTTDGEKLLKCPTETSLTERREKELSDQGFIALCHHKDRDFAVFFSASSTHKPQKYNKEIANANAKLSGRMQYILNASRFAHYLKCIMRDKTGSTMEKENVQEYLDEWIKQYVLVNPNTDDDSKSKYPLREAKIIVEEDPASPGVYKAIIWIRPHYQMEELTISLRIVARLPIGE